MSKLRPWKGVWNPLANRQVHLLQSAMILLIMTQADTILELENDVTKAKKQEKVYEDAIEQLQTELDALEAENAQLRKSQKGDRTGLFSISLHWILS